MLVWVIILELEAKQYIHRVISYDFQDYINLTRIINQIFLKGAQRLGILSESRILFFDN